MQSNEVLISARNSFNFELKKKDNLYLGLRNRSSFISDPGGGGKFLVPDIFIVAGKGSASSLHVLSEDPPRHNPLTEFSRGKMNGKEAPLPLLIFGGNQKMMRFPWWKVSLTLQRNPPGFRFKKLEELQSFVSPIYCRFASLTTVSPSSVSLHHPTRSFYL